MRLYIDLALRRMLFRPASITLFLMVLASNGPVRAQSNTSIVTVEGEVANPKRLTRVDLTSLKQSAVSANDHSGALRKYNGVALADILAEAGVTLGSQLRGKNLLKYVVISGADGYQVVFSLPEIDPEFTSQTILLAYQVDGSDLAKEEGAFRIVVPNDKKHARWVRDVTAIKVVAGK